jgi:hypothetical protein
LTGHYPVVHLRPARLPKEKDHRCITLRKNESCDVGVECRRCGEHGFAIATVDVIKWNDDD